MDKARQVSAIPRPARFERPRPRLLTALAGNLDVPLVVLAAPAGYGKTTLLAQYARSTTRPVAWCRVQPHDGPAEVVARLASCLPDLRAHLTADPRTPPDALARRLAAALALRNAGTDLIVDNLESETLAPWLGQLADLLEEGHRLLISTYTTAGLRLARRLADGGALVLDAADLAFDPQETQAYLDSRGQMADPAVLAQLAGWPAGLALSAHGVLRYAAVDDLVLEALDAVPQPLRRCLPALAPLDVWTEATAARLAPDFPPGGLAVVQRSGLPISALRGNAFQPHRLLLQVLDTLLNRDPERARQARTEAARLSEDAGDLDRAAELYLQAGCPGDAVRLAHILVPRYRDRGEHRRTRVLLEALPLLLLPPALQERLAWAQLETGHAEEGEATLQRLLETGTLTPAGYASLAMVRGRQGRTAEQLGLAREGLQQAGAGPAAPSLYWPLAYAALQLGHLQEAEAVADRAVLSAGQSGDQVRVAEAWQLQSLVWRQTRPGDDAERPLIRAQQIYEALGWSAPAAAVQLDAADLAVRRGRLDGTLAQLQATEHAFAPDQYAHRVIRLRLLATVERRLGQPERAEDTLRTALKVAQGGRLAPESVGVSLELADTLLQLGAAGEANGWLRLAPPLAWPLSRAVLQSMAQGTPLEVGHTEIHSHPDAETRLRALLLLAETGDPEALNAARQELGRSPHARFLHHDLALRRRLEATPAAALLPVPNATEAGQTEVPPPGLVLNIRTLGDVQVQLNGHPVSIGLAKAREVLVWLALHGSGSRDELVTALWDGSAEERHAEYFRVAVRRLRAALRTRLPLGLDPLPYDGGRYRLDVSLSVRLDVAGMPDAGWLRPFLPGVESEWVQQRRAQYAASAVAALLDRALTLPPAQAAETYQLILSADPLLGAVHEALILTLCQANALPRARQALTVYAEMLRLEYRLPLPARFLSQLPPALEEGGRDSQGVPT
ncbi:hypothetical protein MF271_20570 (plasmid) [Deinococcus sp. KNUC1210]|uniref:hypothetical protein n=1 Tax=Deinococcus sp. KNUC1210 TaxID=2917691 RepID=UPI001EEF9A55|nr:hypothetical protein [Deinococcus sp. KNUC1210]ULH17793.1 hypothetical protein MF271_20570 [Deinococcus sp. KNUC1210]